MSPETSPPPDVPASKPKASPPRTKFYRLALASLLILFLGAAGGYLYLEREFATPAEEGEATPVLLQVRPGMGLERIAHALWEKNLIKKPTLFIYQVRLRGGAKRLHAGYYAFRPSMSPREIYRDIVEGRRVERTITIPEGYNLRELAHVIEDSGLAEYGEIIALAHTAEFLSTLRVGASSAEGYLFPDTYRFPLGMPARKILKILVDTLKRKIDDKLRRRAAELGFTIHEVLTLASIVEKETSLDGERPLIASVFLNRLRRNMRLQSDPTVIYALPNFDGNLRKRDLSYDSPYNTYLYKGLPPGPITSPGLASIRAVLYPADQNYLYFVATQEGGHKFSRTYQEHRAAVARYQLNRKGKVDPKSP